MKISKIGKIAVVTNQREAREISAKDCNTHDLLSSIKGLLVRQATAIDQRYSTQLRLSVQYVSGIH